MNRSLLEGDPHAVLEGMLIAGLTIGAAEGFIYCRAEYPLALERLAVAIGQAEEAGFLGPDALGPGRPFRIRVKEGAGAFVCGEETALIASLEGRARHAAAPSALPRGQRALGAPHGHQQRGDPRLRRAHLPARRRLVRRVRHREEQGHQDLRPGRQRAAAGAGRGAAGHDAAADDLRHRRRGRRRATGSRPSRPAVPPGAACPRTSSTSRWTTSRSRRRERSWGPAASS